MSAGLAILGAARPLPQQQGDRRRRGGDDGGWRVTSGGAAVTSGDERRARRIAWLVFAALGAALAAVDAASIVDERTRIGRPVEGWEPWLWEFSSLAGFLLVAPLVFRASQRLRPPVWSWPAAIAVHVLLSGLTSLAHVAIMFGLRHSLYWAAGDAYDGDPIAQVLVFEYRKDALTYVGLVLLPHIVRRFVGGGAAAEPQPEAGHRIEVRDGSRVVWLAPEDVEWAQAAGNYVELHGAFGSLLHRATLSALEAELEPFGFRRVHRSRIVRAAAVRSIAGRASGDFEVTLTSGETVAGSRRFRDRLG